MDRRAFLAALGAVAVAPFVPAPAPIPAFSSSGLMFRADAFECAFPTRLDVLYGYGCIAPHIVVSIAGA